MPIDTSKSGGSVTHGQGHGHLPDGTDPEIYTPRIPPTEGGHDSNNPYGGSGVLIMNAKNEDRTASFFAQPGILAGELAAGLFSSFSFGFRGCWFGEIIMRGLGARRLMAFGCHC